MANPNGTLLSGTLLKNGTYRIESILGQGGFGITYLSTHVSLGKNVVVKEFFMQGYSVRNQDQSIGIQSIEDGEYRSYKERFLDEARMLAKFEGNPNIVGVTDHFEERNTAYFVMPLLKGKNLGQIAKASPNGRITEKDTINILNQLARALTQVHAEGVLHRDIKPENIIITEREEAVLIDFGAAREFIRQEASKHSVLLTPGFAPIEQYDVHAVRGAFTDIYAVGATLYKVLTGKNPPASPTRSIEQMPEPRTLNPEISGRMNALIMRAMALRPQERFQSVKEMMLFLSTKEPAPDTTIIIQPQKSPSKENLHPKEKKSPTPEKIASQQESKLQEKADRLFRTGKYKEALTFYRQMLGANLSDVYAQKQVAECEAKIAPKLQRSKSWVWKVALGIILLGGVIGVSSNIDQIKSALSGDDADSIINAPELQLVTGGFFQMGVPYFNTEADQDEKPKHSVRVSDFYIGKREISVREYRTFCIETKTPMPAPPIGGWVETNPVVNVSRRDALKYCDWLTKKTGSTYRLPTEAEWEYAAKGGNKSKGKIYSGSDKIDDVAWHSRNAGGSPNSTATKKSNEIGLFDMSGNVWEWVADDYDATYYKSSPKDNPLSVKPKVTGKLPNSNIGVSLPRLGVLRGGSFRSYHHDLRITDRLYFDESKGKSDFGFRVVRNP